MGFVRRTFAMSKMLDTQDSTTWNAEFAARLEAYQKLIDDQRAQEKSFDDERRTTLEELRHTWLQQLKESEDQLLEVAPIFADDVGAIPTRRAAYSDRTAAMMAKIAMLTYIAFEDADKKKILDGILTHGRVKLLETLAARETEVLVADTDKFVVVAFRGTTSRRDRRTDLQTRFTVSRFDIENRSVAVSVHSGFYSAFSKVEAPLRDLLVKSGEKPIYLTGHSLGGALALVASAVLGGDAKLGDRIAAVYTFGAPRVGQRNFSEIVKAPHYRIVNNGDLVPLVPPTWLRGYTHTGTPILLKKHLNRPVRRSPWGSAALFALLGIALWPLTRQLLFFRAHDSRLYVANLERIARYRGKWT
jgi:predicted lipase